MQVALLGVIGVITLTCAIVVEASPAPGDPHPGVLLGVSVACFLLGALRTWTDR